MPTVVVGNWVVGGAGKTPTVMALLRHLKQQGWTPGVVSRGYGRQGSGIHLIRPAHDDATLVGDEPLLLAQNSACPVVVGRDRVAARELLLRLRPEVNLVVCDDGLQHLRLPRDLDVVVVDERGQGNGLCLPAGPLRQPIPRTVPPRTLLLYTAGRASLDLPGHRAQRRLVGVQEWAQWRRQAALSTDGGWPQVRGRVLWAAAGIAVPQRFFDALRAQGVQIRAHPLPDHADFNALPWPSDTPEVIVTEKDAVKLTGRDLGATRVWVARLDLEIETTFWSEMDQLLAPWRPRA